MSTLNEYCWVDGCQACGPDAAPGAVCPMTLPLAVFAELTPEEQARRDRVTQAIVKFQSKAGAPPRRWRR